MRTSDNKVLLSYSDLDKLPQYPESPILELHDGELFMVPSPMPKHQTISLNLGRMISNFLVENETAKVYLAPIDVILDQHNTVVPDLTLISAENYSIIKENNIQGVPDTIIEILSSNTEYDTKKKKSLYEQFKVREYWIVDPINEEITVYTHDGEEFYQQSQKKRGGNNSIFMNSIDLELSIEEIFRV